MKRLLVLLLGTLFLAACARSAASTTPASPASPVKVTVSGGSYTNISAIQLHSMLNQKDFRLVNVHIPYEGEIAQTDAFVPYNEIDQNLNKLPADKSAKIVLYCRSGRMSSIAAESLVRLGYTNVWNLDGGMVGWETQGYEVVQK